MFLPCAEASSNGFLWLAVSLLRCLILFAGVEGSEAWFLLGLQGEWFSDTVGLGDLRGDLACIVAALGIACIVAGLVRLLNYEGSISIGVVAECLVFWYTSITHLLITSGNL
jgi:hypothetical protein